MRSCWTMATSSSIDSSWPGLSRPSTSFLLRLSQDVDARHRRQVYAVCVKQTAMAGHNGECVTAHSFNNDAARPYFAPAFCAYSQEACDSGTVRLADSIALAFAAVPSRTRPAMPWVIPARRNRLYEKYQFKSGTALPVTLQ